jgi:hypothetical protein
VVHAAIAKWEALLPRANELRPNVMLAPPARRARSAAFETGLADRQHGDWALGGWAKARAASASATFGG